MKEISNKSIKEILTTSELEFSKKMGLNDNSEIHEALNKYLSYISKLGYFSVSDMEDVDLTEDEKIVYSVTMKLYDNLLKY